MEPRPTIRLAAGVLAGLCLAPASASPATFSCPALNGAKPEAHLEYLQRERSTLSPDCISSAMDQLGLKHYAPAVKTLIAYLDYRLPDDPAKKRGIIIHIPTLGDTYPASTALFRIGKPATPNLVEAIANISTSDIARTNAIETLFVIHSGKLSELVTILNRASKESKDLKASDRLRDAAREITYRCQGPDIPLCLAALQQ